VYCPICGDHMDTEGATFECVRGEMVLSMDMAKGLHESFVARSVPPIEPTRVPSPSFRWGGIWFCPGCGIQMEDVAGTNGVKCSQCGGNLGPFIYMLIERHFHRSGDGSG
jgi:tRNA(Ile2) C34 agmatinyltransferase TiaS